MIPVKSSVQLKVILALLFFAFAAQPVFAQSGKKKGKVSTYYSNGKKESSGKVKNYQKQGTWKFWDEEGKLQKTSQYKDGKLNGLTVSFYPDGSKSEEGNYSNGKKTGTWNAWYLGNVHSSELNYKDGEPEGTQRYWYENGQLQQETVFENFKMTSHKSWYKSGKLRMLNYFKAGLPEGTWRYYPDLSESKDTFPLSIDNYANGKREGLHAAYSHGKLSEEIFYKNDLLDGSYKKWDYNGYLGVSENYKKGLRDGACSYYNYGKPIREATYADGKINGEEKEYDSKGMTTHQNWYRMGVIDSAHSFHPNGQLATSRVYHYYPGFVRTEEFSDYTEWNEKGELLLKGVYHFETKDKDWTTFYPNGAKKSITPYSNGKMNGVYKKWYASGKEAIEFECRDNAVASAPKVWDEKGKPIKAGTKAYQEIVDSNLPGEIYNDPKGYRENRPSEPDLPPPVMQEETGDVPEVQKEINMADLGPEPPPVFTFVEDMPEFPGGQQTLQKFMQDNIHFPDDEFKRGMQGTVYVSFIVEPDGSLTNIKAVKEVKDAPGFTKEAIRVISIMPKWTTGKMNGRAVRTQYTLPVKFALQ